MKLQRWDPPNSCTKMSAWIPCDDGDYCYSDDVARLEASHAELEAKCAVLEKQLSGYAEAFDCIDSAVSFAHRLIAEPEMIVTVDLPTERSEALHASVLEAAKDMLQWWESSGTSGGSGYIDRLRAAIAKAEREGI